MCFRIFLYLVLQCHCVLWRHFDHPALAGVLFVDGSCKMVTEGTGTCATSSFHSRWGSRCCGAGYYASQEFVRRKKFSFPHVQWKLCILKWLKYGNGKWGKWDKSVFKEKILLLWQLGFGSGEVNVLGSSMFLMGQIFTSQRSELLAGLVLGGAMGRKAIDYGSTKAESLSWQEGVTSHQRHVAPLAPWRAVL